MRIKSLLFSFFLMLSFISCDFFKSEYKGGTLRVLKSKPALNLDPACAVSMDSAEVITQIYEPLVEFNKNQEIEYVLAESINTSDNIHWNIELKHGIKFHNGVLLTSKAVVETFTRQLKGVKKQNKNDSCSYAYWKTYFAIVKDVKAKGDYSVEVTLNKPYPLFMYSLSLFAIDIVPPKDSLQTSLNKHPVGTGPFKFIYKDQEGNVLLERFDKYWNRKKLPNYRYLQFKIISSEKRRILALRGGAAHIVTDFNYQNLAPLSLHPGIKVSKSSSAAIAYLAFNTMRPPFDNRTNRLAIAYAISRERLIKYVYQGNAHLLDCPFPCKMVMDRKEYNKLPWHEHSPEKARTLLLNTGLYNRAEPLKLYVVDKPRIYLPAPKLTAEMVATSLREIGLRVKIISLPYQEFKFALKKGKHDLALHGWIPDYPVVSSFLYPLLYTRVLNGKPAYNLSLNIAGYYNQEFNSVLDKALMVSDITLRKNYYKQAVQIFWKDIPWIPLAVINYMVLHSSIISNVYLSKTGIIKYSTLKFEGGK